MPGTVLGVIASWHRLYLTAKPSHVWGRGGWASLPPHHPIAYSHQLRGAELPIRHCLVPSCGSGRWRLPGGVKPPCLDI
jgi:hypothetical protein